MKKIYLRFRDSDMMKMKEALVLFENEKGKLCEVEDKTLWIENHHIYIKEISKEVFDKYTEAMKKLEIGKLMVKEAYNTLEELNR